MFREFGLKMPIHAPFWAALGVLRPTSGGVSTSRKRPKGTFMRKDNTRRTSSKSVHRATNARDEGTKK